MSVHEHASSPVHQAESGWKLRLRHAYVAVVMFVVGLGLGQSGNIDGLGRFAAEVFATYVEAQKIMLQARENVGADGRIEFAVMAEDSWKLEVFVADRQDWSVRESAVPGWRVVAIPQVQEDGLAQLREQPFVRVAWRNRGLWLCH